jgi:hypothetical protein
MTKSTVTIIVIAILIIIAIIAIIWIATRSDPDNCHHNNTEFDCLRYIPVPIYPRPESQWDKDSSYIWIYTRNSYKPLVKVPEHLTFDKIETNDRNTNKINGDRYPTIYGSDLEHGLYTYSSEEQMFKRDMNWVNVAPSSFVYYHPDYRSINRFKLVDFTLTDSSRVFAVYQYDDVSIVVEIVDRDAEIPDGETLMAYASSSKLISYNSDPDIRVDSYSGQDTAYGVQTTRVKGELMTIRSIRSIAAFSKEKEGIIVSLVGYADSSIGIYQQNGLKYQLVKITTSKQRLRACSTDIASYQISASEDRQRVILDTQENMKDWKENESVQPPYQSKLNLDIFDYDCQRNCDTSIVMAAQRNNTGCDIVHLYWKVGNSNDIGGKIDSMMVEVMNDFNSTTRVSAGDGKFYLYQKPNPLPTG